MDDKAQSAIRQAMADGYRQAKLDNAAWLRAQAKECRGDIVPALSAAAYCIERGEADNFAAKQQADRDATP